MPAPLIGRVVHYVSYGTPGGEYTMQCRAAIITEVSDSDPDHVGLFVQNPTGQFFHSLSEGGCHLDPGARGVYPPENGRCDDPSTGRRIDGKGGTWHWPQEVAQ